MKRSAYASLAFAASLLVSSVGAAQTTFHFEGVKNNSVNLAGFGIGAYRASVAPFDNASKFDVYCIDFDNRAQSVWTARVLTFAQATSNPTNLAALNRVLGSNPAWSLQNLQAAAYLTTQFTETNRVAGKWDDIHGAIWSMFSTSNTPKVGQYVTYRNDAMSFASTHANDFGDYRILVDENAFNENYRGTYNQTFITADGGTNINVVTPEPGTWALMTAGLMFVGVAGRRRVKKA